MSEKLIHFVLPEIIRRPLPNDGVTGGGQTVLFSSNKTHKGYYYYMYTSKLFMINTNDAPVSVYFTVYIYIYINTTQVKPLSFYITRLRGFFLHCISDDKLLGSWNWRLWQSSNYSFVLPSNNGKRTHTAKKVSGNISFSILFAISTFDMKKLN